VTGDVDQGDSPEEPTWQFQFRGRRVVSAWVDSLLAVKRLGAATHVMVTGDSAGGVAALNNADFMLQRALPSLTRLEAWKVYMDAGWFLDISRFSSPTVYPMRDIAQALQRVYNATWDVTCVSGLPSDEAWKCFFPQYWWHRFPLPLMVGEMLYDSWQLWMDQAATQQDAEALRSAMVHTLRDVTLSQTTTTRSGAAATSRRPGAMQSHTHDIIKLLSNVGGRQGVKIQHAARRIRANFSINKAYKHGAPSVFASACRLHQVEDTQLWAALRVGSTHLSSAIAQWFFNGTRVQVLDDHEGERPLESCSAVPKASS